MSALLDKPYIKKTYNSVLIELLTILTIYRLFTFFLSLLINKLNIDFLNLFKINIFFSLPFVSKKKKTE